MPTPLTEPLQLNPSLSFNLKCSFQTNKYTLPNLYSDTGSETLPAENRGSFAQELNIIWTKHRGEA